MYFRDADEKASLQRKREEEAEAKIAARKAGHGGATRVPERSAPARADSTERSAGPPRLALVGNKPTWRERQVQKEAEVAAGGAAPVHPPAPPSDIATTEAQLPKRTGYVAPARRTDSAAPRGRTDDQAPFGGRDESSGGDAPPKWRPSGVHPDSGRDGSPANGPAPRFLAPGRRGTDGPGARDQSPADGAGATKYPPRFQRDGGAPARSETPPAAPARTDSPANGVSAPAPGKYVPVHLRNKGA